MDRALQTFEQVDTHEAADAFFTPALGQTVALVVGQLAVFGDLAWENVFGGRIDLQREQHQLLIDFVVVDCTRQIGQMRAKGDGLPALWELADFRSVIKLLNMLAGARNCDAVKHFKEVKIQRAKQIVRRALLDFQLAPGVEGLLRLAEDFINGFCCGELAVDQSCIALISQGELIAQVGKAVVHRRCREHQDLGFHSRTNDLVQQLQITVLLLVLA